ncbi:hypothetical protein OG900_07585 [Streptomyces sp. NBC_00433]
MTRPSPSVADAVLPGAPVRVPPGRRAPRRSARCPAPVALPTALAAVTLVHLPYVLAPGGGVPGYLSGCPQEEGHEPGGVRRFGLLPRVPPDDAAGPAAVTLGVAMAVPGAARRPAPPG